MSTFLCLKMYDGLQSLHYDLKWTDGEIGTCWVKRRGLCEGLCVQWSRLKLVRRVWWICWKSNKPPMKKECNIKFLVMPINTKGFKKNTTWNTAKPRFKLRYFCSLSLKFSYTSLMYNMYSLFTSDYIQKQTVKCIMISLIREPITRICSISLYIYDTPQPNSHVSLAILLCLMLLIHLATPIEWKSDFPMGPI